MKLKLENRETELLTACALLLLLALFGPATAQPARYHDFADHRVWWGVPHAMDLLSNLPFALWACAGVASLVRGPWASLEQAQRRTAALFFGGLCITAAGSGCYHWMPDDAGLALDRLGMVVPFAGLLGLVAAGRVSARSGDLLGLGTLALGPLCIAVWLRSGNVLPWAVLQFGAMVLVLWLSTRPALPGAWPIRWGAVIFIYAVAKLLEQYDHQVYELLGHAVSGHSLKHLVASLAAWPVWSAVRHVRHTGQDTTSGKIVARRGDHAAASS